MHTSIHSTLIIDVINLGDFYLPEINWHSNSSVKSDSDRLVNFAEDNYLTQYDHEPTCGTNILDLVFSNQEHLILYTQIRGHLGTCNHNMIKFKIDNQFNPQMDCVFVTNFSQAGCCFEKLFRSDHVPRLRN